MTTHERKLLRQKTISYTAQEFLNYRFKHHLTQAQFARSLGIDVRAYLSLEHGVSMPSLMTLLRYLCYCLTPEEAEEFVAGFRLIWMNNRLDRVT